MSTGRIYNNTESVLVYRDVQYEHMELVCDQVL